MSLKEQINSDIKEAMKSREQGRVETLRFVQAAIKYREIEVRPNTITEQDIVGVLKKLQKQRMDSIEQFEKAGRKDLVDKEKFELGVLESYLPSQMSKEQIEAVVADVMKTQNANSIKQMGAVMKEVIARTAGAADSKLVSEIVKSKLS